MQRRGGTKRKLADEPSTTTVAAAASPAANGPAKRRRATSKATSRSAEGNKYKGLRHFSLQVCQKVQERGTTTYNEVADDLVVDVMDTRRSAGEKCDEKNIRRRVYDALNVLMAMNIISKEKKVIRWVGLPSNSAQELAHLTDQKEEQLKRIADKRKLLRDLIMQQVAQRNLTGINAERENAQQGERSDARIHLPFIVVNTDKDTVIECEMAEDRDNIVFKFSAAFELHDHHDILKRMGLQSVGQGASIESLKPSEVGGSVPQDLLEQARGISWTPDEDDADDGSDAGTSTAISSVAEGFSGNAVAGFDAVCAEDALPVG